MKKFLMALVVAALTVMACVAMVACGGTSYAGEYHYNNHNTEYGVKVEVSVTDGKIDSVKIVDSDYTQLSPANPDYGWTDANRKVYQDGEAAFIKSFEGKTVEAVKAYSVTKAATGEPTAVAAEGLSLVTGATQSCGRLILAVQDALKDVK